MVTDSPDEMKKELKTLQEALANAKFAYKEAADKEDKAKDALSDANLAYDAMCMVAALRFPDMFKHPERKNDDNESTKERQGNFRSYILHQIYRLKRYGLR